MTKRTKRALKVKKPPYLHAGSVTETEKEKIKKTKVRVVGIGGGAGNIVSELSVRIEKASFAAANTDLQALRTLRRDVLRFQFGENLTRGLGTGMNSELAREAALNEKEKIKNLFKGQDFCILVGALGGGVGSGASPVFAKIAKGSGAITLGVFTLPFKFEGEEKQEMAREAIKKLRPYLNTIIILPNDRIFQIIDKSTPLREALSAINKNLADSLEGLIETIYLPGLINIDFADLRTILQGQGRFAYLNTVTCGSRVKVKKRTKSSSPTVEVQGANRALEAIKKALSCPLYPYTIKGAKRVLFNITGEKELSLSDVSQISKTIFELVNPEAKIIFGISQDKKYQDRIKIMLLATGCGAKVFSDETERPHKKKKKKAQKELPQPKKRKIKRKRKSKPKTKPKPRTKRKSKKVKARKKEPLMPETEEKPAGQIEIQPADFSERGVEVKVRKNALQIRKEAEEAEKEFLEKERTWELPAFLRKPQNK